MTQKVFIIAGGTVVHVRPHFAFAAPAYGTVGAQLAKRLQNLFEPPPNANTRDEVFASLSDALRGSDPWVEEPEYKAIPIYTRMASFPNGYDAQQVLEAAGLKHVETNADVEQLIAHLMTQEDTRCIVMAAAICDWEPHTMQANYYEPAVSHSGTIHRTMPVGPGFGKDARRLKTRDSNGDPTHLELVLLPSDKIVGGIRNGPHGRKNVFLVTFKTTAGETAEGTYAAGLKALKSTSSNLVFANDIHNHHNVVVTPEEYPYYAETREDALDNLAEMIHGRIQLTFTRTSVLDGDKADIKALHEAGLVPSNFVPVLSHLIEAGAYKVLPWKDSTSGHFGCKVEVNTEGGFPEFSRVASVRKANHNLVFEEGMAKILGKAGSRILAVGARPSVGEHTQNQIYDELPDADAIVHFHCEKEPRSTVPDRPQRMFECGSDQCGSNTATGMTLMLPGIWAVHLEGHGPNIAFSRDVDPETVIAFIEHNWDLDQKSGGNLTE